MIDIKMNHVEISDEIARRIPPWRRKSVRPRKWVHLDCGFWILKRSIADRKMEALVKGRDLYLGR